MQLAHTEHQLPGAALFPHAARHYAKAAKGGGAAAAAAAPAGGGAAGPKKYRTSMSKLYSCRNDRMRHTHEQIWPTLQLTEVEQAMFRRSSRVFVVDMGRSVSLESKYRMGLNKPAVAAKAAEAAAEGASEAQVAAVASAVRRAPYHQARTLLYEPQLHLDAVGENPRYLRIRRVGSMFATKLQNVRKLRLLLGFQRRRFLQRMYEGSLLAPGPHRMWKMVCAMESHLPVFATRMGMAEDVVGAVSAVRHGRVHVNGKRPEMPWAEHLAPGDVVGPAPGSSGQFHKRVTRSLSPLEGDIIRCTM
ncbi:hypothetical protein GPECTOR_69g426 [Gonium pectorale]|uniref:Uncharacterized protein n=1 Tax=Gonium pectorale TaxID=33097 RepID=A0A150G3D9_GONPE|nr:hypothetical protein GPECTOR_69g426 [Gonium pectorale]|eukprot:KXZ44333.1 hypothetical protein GPECTOR_69g426 [Gonium pectorale]